MKKTFVKRGRLEIIYEILSVSRKPTKKTRILYSCNLSYDQLQKYLGYLGQNDLLNSFSNKGKERYRTTEKGLEYIREYERLNSFLEEKQNPVIIRNTQTIFIETKIHFEVSRKAEERLYNPDIEDSHLLFTILDPWIS